MNRPVLYVLAGVNGAGKSSIGGHLLTRAGLAWYNPDSFARALVRATGIPQTDANAQAWQEGVRRLDEALLLGRTFALETTLGGRTLPRRLREATATHDVLIWFCGLTSPALHIERVRARVAAGGHDIPEARIHERYDRSRENLIALLPHVHHISLFDNSASVAPGDALPDPLPIARIHAGRLVWPLDSPTLAVTPEWARPVLGACMA